MRFVLAPILFLFSLGVQAVPAWEAGRSAIGSLVSGATYIEALGTGEYTRSKHLSTAAPGEPIPDMHFMRLCPSLNCYYRTTWKPYDPPKFKIAIVVLPETATALALY